MSEKSDESNKSWNGLDAAIEAACLEMDELLSAVEIPSKPQSPEQTTPLRSPSAQIYPVPPNK
jgi:hypothetical protein